MHWIPRGILTCVQGQCWKTPSVQTGTTKDLKEKHFIRFQRLNLSSLQCLRTFSVILIHENPTLFYVCVDSCVGRIKCQAGAPLSLDGEISKHIQ